MDIPVEELKRMAFKRIPLASLPDEFEGEVEDASIRTDSRGRRALYMVIKLEDGSVTQKFTALHLSALVDSLLKLGIGNVAEMKGGRYLWRKAFFGVGNPRWLPVRRIQ